MSKLILRETDFSAITPAKFPLRNYYIVGIDIDGGFKKMDYLGKITSIGGGSRPFNGDRVVTRPGLPAVVIGPVADVHEFTEKMFFPDQGPLMYMSCDHVREFGASLDVVISWSVMQRSNPIVGIVVDGNNIGPNGQATQSGQVTRRLPGYNNTTFYGTAVDGGGASVAAQDTITWAHKRFAFSNVNNLLLSSYTPSAISTLLNSLSTSSYTLSNSKNGQTTLDPSGQYMYFAFVLEGNEAAANFIINTLPNNAFTFRDFVYVNQFGFQKTFRIYKSGNITGGTFNVTVS